MIDKIENLNGNQITILGHGGMGEQFKYPSNSYESVEPCLRIGADGVEIDIQISQDGIPIVFHDKYMNDKASCTGMIHDQNWSEINGCTYNSILSNKINIRSLGALISDISDYSSHIFSLDCKLHTNSSDFEAYLDQFVSSIHGTAVALNIRNNVIVETGSVGFLNRIKELDDSYRLFINVTSMDQGISICEDNGFYGIVIATDNASKESIQRAHEKGIRVMLWDLRSVDDNIEAIRKSPDYVQTDKPIHFLKVFGKYKS